MHDDLNAVNEDEFDRIIDEAKNIKKFNVLDFINFSCFSSITEQTLNIIREWQHICFFEDQFLVKDNGLVHIFKILST